MKTRTKVKIISWPVADGEITWELCHDPIWDGPIELYENSNFYTVKEVEVDVEETENSKSFYYLK